MVKKIIGYGSLTVAVFLFQLIYHHFGHGVVSTTLRFVWLVPLIGGLVWWLLQRFFPDRLNRLAFNAYNSGLAALSFWCILQGILAIAGSDSPYLWSYLVLAGLSFGVMVLTSIRGTDQKA